ncbi:hypothetical protein [Plasmodium yoelii yoelii]|uniref:Uncharacterized protein n=1 Tax=Plasmodium yoelii yoelii TaxID=73239 RepID=Q7RSP2_PLAYO|nr:hypothetical protein [Plasmodium yoelii yoelii]
MICIIQYSP